MTKTLPFAAALLACTVAAVPLVASVALAPPAAAIERSADDIEGAAQDEALAERGIAVMSIDEAPDAQTTDIPQDDQPAVSDDVEFIDEDGNTVEHDPGDLDTRRTRGEIEPAGAQIVPISADVDEGLSVGVIAAVAAGGLVVAGGGAVLVARSRKS